MNLTRSQYMIAKQCPKALWLHKNKPEILENDNNMEEIFKNDRVIRKYARGLFPDGVPVEFDDDVLKKTKSLIKQGTQTIYGSAFSFQGFFTMCDILHRGQKGWEIYEVKNSTGLKPEYIQDAVFQYYIMSNAEILIDKINVVYINNQYERDGGLELKELFLIEDISSQVKVMKENISKELDIIMTILIKRYEPEITIGEHCTKPNECACKSYCWQHIPEHSVFSLAGMKNQKKFEMYEQGIISFEEIAASGINLSDHAAEIQVHSQLNDENIINIKEIEEFLNTTSLPLYFLDFETFEQPIPMLDRQMPYEQIPFQYSLHYVERDGGELKHKEFLAKEGQDPRRELAERLVNDIPENVCIMAYNMQLEKMVIKRLACQFEYLSGHLMNIHENIVDLMLPFKNKHYYMKEMKGNYSIKHVLPALFPDDEEMDYSRLNIQNGNMAMQMFANLHLREKDEIERTRKNLLEYCRMHTLAMVRIWEKLRGEIQRMYTCGVIQNNAQEYLAREL